MFKKWNYYIPVVIAPNGPLIQELLLSEITVRKSIFAARHAMKTGVFNKPLKLMLYPL